jgi:RimJ/RimL family protein N-acetyltransferase
LVFTAVETDLQEVVGHIELLAIDRVNQTATVGRVLIGPARLRGTGLGAEMMRAVLRIGFEELGLHRIDLRVFTFNHSAIACYKKVGFQTEGLLREAYRAGQEHWSVYVMSLLEHEWRGQA